MRFAPLDVDELVLAAQKPSRYVGGEVNSISKDLRAMRATWALCFPDTYEVGMSNVGFRLLYHLLNRREDVACERAFMPWPDMAALQRARGLPLWSMESRAPLRDFDILGFSLQFEACYTTCLEMLDLARVPLFAAERSEHDPLVIAGGPCAYSGEPVAPFFDALVLGEGEEVVGEISDLVIDWKRSKGTRRELLWKLAEVPGVYVPSLFEPHYAADGTIAAVEPKKPGYERVSRRVVADLNLIQPPERPLVPFMQTVHDRLPLELQRGCTRGCRFCQAGMISRPARQRDPRQVLAQAEKGLKATGYEEVGFLSLSAGDYACINGLLEDFFARFAPERISISLPSLRTETMNERLAAQIARVKKTGFTIAPEAATDRLRAAINKGNSEENLLKAVESIFKGGWSLVKLYFMIGLPTETDRDVQAIADLSKKAHKLARSVRPDNGVNVSVSTFIPKPFTPFQWEPMITVAETIRRHDLLRAAMPRKGSLALRYHEAKGSLIEAALARGDRRLATAVHAAWKQGQVLDGWTEHFDFSRWERALEVMQREHGVSLEFMVHRERAESEVLPWDHLDAGVSKKFLLRERARSREGVSVEDCATGRCGACTACDFKTVEPRVYSADSYVPVTRLEAPAEPVPEPALEPAPEPAPEPVAAEAAAEPAGDQPRPDGEPAEAGAEPVKPKVKQPPPPPKHHVRIRHAKEGQSIAISHLETMNLLLRALRRSGLPVAYSQGFSPRPRISFGPACPVGIESKAEFLDVELARPVEPQAVRDALGPELPPTFRLLEVAVLPERSPSLNAAMAAMHYLARFPEGVAEADLRAGVEAFAARPAWEIQREKHGKGSAGRSGKQHTNKTIDLKQAVLGLELAGPREVRFQVRVSIDGSARPLEVLTTVFGGAQGVRLTKEEVSFHPEQAPAADPIPESVREPANRE